MKVHYRHLIITTAVVVLVLISSLIYAVREFKSALERENARIQKLEAQLNTLEVEGRQPEAATYDPCGLTVVVCKNEEVTFKLQ